MNANQNSQVSKFPAGIAGVGSWLTPKTLTIVFLAVLGLGGCGSSERATVNDLQLLRRAISDPGHYLAAVTELEKTPQSALLALSEQSAPSGTRKEFLLRLIADHVRTTGRYAEWDAIAQQSKAELTPLTQRRHFYFWSEKLLFSDAAAGVTAMRHLNSIGGDEVAAVASWRILDVGRDPDKGFHAAAETLGRAGKVQELLAGLSAWFELQNSANATSAVMDLQATLQLLPAQLREPTERRLLGDLEKSDLPMPQRRACLAMLQTIASGDSIERLAKLRRLPWGLELRRDIDAVLLVAMSRDTRLAQFDGLTIKSASGPGAKP